MAFENKQEKISQILKETEAEVSQPVATQTVDTFERTKQYQFTLQPTVRKKIDQLAKENGYRSASSYLNDHFKHL
ncbi:hypothetical protein [Streptococcus sobrinus]|uniref:hypothetical protein n=1 Tax=Streptococcus sobrinus TaxID=1310 RepID=UPI00031CAF30|nr:hypothetical protein [Streptococcus sobrinus]